MKPSALLLLFSLVANGALVAALMLRPAPPATATTTPLTAPTGATPAAAPGQLAAAKVETAPATPLWSRLRSNNLDELNRRLRAAGIPAKQVRLIMAMTIQDQMTAERDALLGKREDIPYWRNPYGQGNAEQQAQVQEMYRKANALNYKYINGPDSLADDEEARHFAQRRFGNLPLEKLQQLVTLQHDAQDLQMQANNRFRGLTDAASRTAYMESLQALEREKMAQIGKLLTPAELEQYELRNNAAGLSTQLAAFRPTEEEFKAIYAIQKAGRESVSDANLTPAQRTALQAETQAQLTAALGEERAADYLALQKAGSDKLPLLIARLDLPLSILGTIATVRSDINSRAQAVAENKQLTAAQRQAELATLATEAREKLTETLGARGYEAYNDLKGDWIRALKPKG